MSKRKPTVSSTKSLEYVRPQPGSFTLEKFPGVEFKFRIVNVDDESWCVEAFGKNPWGIVFSGNALAADLCRLYFQMLTDESKLHFVPVEKDEIDYERGGKSTVVISGPRLFMQSIDGGSLVEMTLIGNAFLQTLLASRPLSALPEDQKKNLMKWIERHKAPVNPLSETTPLSPVQSPPPAQP